MSFDILYTKNSNVIPGITVFIDHASRPPYRIKIQLNAIKCWLKINLIYCPTTTNFIFAITFKKKINKAKGTFFFKRYYFCSKL